MRTNDATPEHINAIIGAAFALSETVLGVRLQAMRCTDVGLVAIPTQQIERANDVILDQLADLVGAVRALVYVAGGDPDDLS